jgi:serine/threonine-protein kinase
MRASIGAAEGDYGLTRHHSRRTTRLIDRAAADLLEEFRAPSSIPEAIERFSRKSGLVASDVIHGSFDFLTKMVRDGFLVTLARHSRSKMGPVETAGGWRVLEPLRILEDTEVHLVHAPSEARGVLKRVACDAERWVRQALRNEARILRQLNGAGAPELLEDGSDRESPYIVVGWRPGLPSGRAAAELRRPWVPDFQARLRAVCLRVLDAYVDLHGRGVLHGDVQPGNVLIDVDSDAVSLIDFGLAVDENGPALPASLRGGVEAFYAPESARAVLADQPLPHPTASSEQYIVAALVYKLLTGYDYLEPQFDQHSWHEAVAALPPRAFARLGMPPWAAGEEVLRRALAKEPAQRYPSMSAFREAFARACLPAPSPPAGSAAAWQSPGLFEATIGRLVDPQTVQRKPLPRPTASLNYGATGIACFLLRASGTLQRPDLFAAADLWIERARREAAVPSDAFFDYGRGLTEETVGKTALYHSAVGTHCVDALIAATADQPKRLSDAIGRMIDAAQAPELRVDLVTGTAGQLIACATLLEVLTALGLNEERERVIALGERRREDLLGVWGSLEQRLPGTSETYLGIAHGWAGMAYGMLRFAEASGAPVPQQVIDTLQALSAAAVIANGGASWPMGPGNADVWTGWCHGSAGHALLWSQAHRSLGSDTFLELAIMAGEHAWRSAPPDVGHLCCGAAGQAYAFLALHRLTGEGQYVDRARRRLEESVAFVGTPGMSPDSLYKGDLGVALLEIDVSEPLLASMPLFEPEHWR